LRKTTTNASKRYGVTRVDADIIRPKTQWWKNRQGSHFIPEKCSFPAFSLYGNEMNTSEKLFQQQTCGITTSASALEMT